MKCEKPQDITMGVTWEVDPALQPKGKVYEKRFKSDPIDFPGEILAVILRKLDATDQINNLFRRDARLTRNKL